MVLPDLSSTLLMRLPLTVIEEPLVDAGMLKFEVLGMLTAGQASLWWMTAVYAQSVELSVVNVAPAMGAMGRPDRKAVSSPLGRASRPTSISSLAVGGRAEGRKGVLMV